MKNILFVSFVLFFSVLAEAKLPSNNEVLTGKDKTNTTDTANLERLCSRRNIPMDIMVKCLEAGFIMKQSGLILHPATNVKKDIAQKSGCSSQLNDEGFTRCLKNFTKSRAPVAANDVTNCWKLIDEVEFQKCWGWVKQEKAEILPTPAAVEETNAVN